jgi:hypothetical protein
MARGTRLARHDPHPAHTGYLTPSTAVPAEDRGVTVAPLLAAGLSTAGIIAVGVVVAVILAGVVIVTRRFRAAGDAQLTLSASQHGLAPVDVAVSPATLPVFTEYSAGSTLAAFTGTVNGRQVTVVDYAGEDEPPTTAPTDLVEGSTVGGTWLVVAWTTIPGLDPTIWFSVRPRGHWRPRFITQATGDTLVKDYDLGDAAFAQAFITWAGTGESVSAIENVLTADVRRWLVAHRHVWFEAADGRIGVVRHARKRNTDPIDRELHDLTTLAALIEHPVS